MNMDAPLGKEFVIDEGMFARSVEDLAEHLPTMPDNVYYSHVTEERNDFADWIDEIFDLPLLANDMRTTLNRNEMAWKLKAFLQGDHHENDAKDQAEKHDLLEGEAHEILTESETFEHQEAPVVETTELTSADFQESREETIIAQENVIVNNPEDAPVIGLEGEEIAKEISPEVPTLANGTPIPEDLPGIKADKKEEIKQQDANALMQFILMLRYIIATLTFRKLEKKEEKTNVS